MKNIKKIISTIFLITFLFGKGSFKTTHAMKKNSEVKANVSVVTNKKLNELITPKQIDKNALSAWRIAQKKSTIQNWRNAECFCKRALIFYRSINDIKKVNKYKAYIARAIANSEFEFAKTYSTAENWINVAHLFYESYKAYLISGNTRESSVSIELFLLANSLADIANANIAWQEAENSPSFFSWTNAEGFYKQAAITSARINNKNNSKLCSAKAADAYAHATKELAKANNTVENWLNTANAFEYAAKLYINLKQIELSNKCYEEINNSYKQISNLKIQT